MQQLQENDRQRAIERSLEGEHAAAICTAMGYSREWFYKWLRRFRTGDANWFCDRSRRPHGSPSRTSRALEEIDHGSPESGVPGAVSRRPGDPLGGSRRWGGVPLPSVRTIGRILARATAEVPAKGCYKPKHGELFHVYRTGTSLQPSDYTDTVMMCQGERHVLEFTFDEPGSFMFHAHQSEFTELGWMGVFNVVDVMA